MDSDKPKKGDKDEILDESDDDKDPPFVKENYNTGMPGELEDEMW